MRKLTILGAFVLVAALASVGAFAQATGDFKVTGTSYGNSGDADGGDVNIAGTVNHGAIQSGKSVNVEIAYEYSFEYTKTVTVNGVNTITIPAKCPSTENNQECKNKTPQSHPQHFQPTIINEPYTTTTVLSFNGTDGMTSITAPTVVNGRLNPKGKITGYNWAKALTIAPVDSLVSASDIPEGGTLVPGSVQITKVSYAAALKDKEGNVIADTLNTGCLFGCN
ncbi:MAG TPA: hypothetical protein VK421_16305 [Pyrinomonadaceae bacterium]|nr:hypothetical protein [Pyrinomonadaceae bacterium]